MNDALTAALAIASPIVTVVGLGFAGGRSKEKLDTIASNHQRLADRLDHLEDGLGTGDQRSAGVMERLTQVERNTQALGGLSERVTVLETEARIHHQQVTDSLARLDRGQQRLGHTIGNWIAQQGGGKLMVMAPSDD